MSTRPQNSFPKWSVLRMVLLASTSYASISVILFAKTHAGPRPIVVDDPAGRSLGDLLSGSDPMAARRRIP